MVLKKTILMMVIFVLAFAGIPVLGQETVEDPDWARAKEVLLGLAESEEFASEAEMVDAWIEALSDELGPEHPQLLKALSVAARGFYNRGKYRESLRLFEQEVKLSTKVLGAEHPETLKALNNLAQLAQALGDLQRAQDLQKEVLAVRSRILGGEHPDTLTATTNLAATLHALGDLSGARQREEEVLEALSRILGTEHPNTLKAKANLAATLHALGDLSGARQREEEVLAVRSRILGAEHPDTLTAKANLAGTLIALGDLSGARQRYEEVLEVRSRILGAEHPDTLSAKANLAGTLRALGDLSGARQCYEEVLAVLGRILGTEHADTLTAKANLAGTLRALGDLSGARQRYEEVLAVRSRILGAEHPDTLRAKANLAGTLRALGDLSGARQREQEVLAVRSRTLGAKHPDTLRAKANLAGTLRALGDLPGARQRYEEVLADLSRILGAEHPDTLTAKANLAVTLQALGDLAGARQGYEEVLAVRSRILGAKHPDTLKAKANLAGALTALGDLSGARRGYEEVLAVRSRILGAEHPATLAAKANLAVTLSALGDLSGARWIHEEVLAVRSRILGAEHPDTLTTKANLAATLYALGDLLGARHHYEEVLAVRSRILGAEHPDTLTTKSNPSVTLQSLGGLSEARQRYEEVQQRHEEILAVRSRILGAKHPDKLAELVNLTGTLHELADIPGAETLLKQVAENREDAHSLYVLGSIHLRRGELESAAEFYFRSLKSLEQLAGRIDLSEDIKSLFRVQAKVVYRKAISLAFTRQRLAEAFNLLERYRAQSLLAQLRWTRFETLPPELAAELWRIGKRYNHITSELSFGRGIDDESHSALREEKSELRRRRQLIWGLAIEAQRAIQGNVKSIGIDIVRRRLDPGTVILAYSVGDEASYLFVFDRDGPLEAHSLDIGALPLWLQVDRLRSIDLGGGGATSEGRQNLSYWLYDKLLAPAAERIERAERLLILPDGPLNYLHFAALARPLEGESRQWQYLVEWKAVHTVQSAAVYDELLSRRPDAKKANQDEPPWQWIGFGAPNDLPFSSREIQDISVHFPDGRTRIYLGTQATEERVRELLGNTRIAHFATHGFSDPDQPMDSFLALSLLEDDSDGLLQAWEIVDHLHLDADLVVLSACVTAFGPERGGEGLLSLSRAFQIAGARTVMASLWAVNDASTSELMIRFYRHLLAGEPKDRALQLAQLELIRDPVVIENEEGEEVEHDFSAPYHWAAFQLIGDWQ